MGEKVSRNAEGYNITVRPVAEAEYINVTLIFKEESGHDEQKPD